VVVRGLPGLAVRVPHRALPLPHGSLWAALVWWSHSANRFVLFAAPVPVCSRDPVELAHRCLPAQALIASVARCPPEALIMRMTGASNGLCDGRLHQGLQLPVHRVQPECLALLLYLPWDQHTVLLMFIAFHMRGLWGRW
jgi:hypothetical protein